MEEKESLKVGEFLQEFYAVTKSRSVYRISAEKDKDNCPIVEKVALNGKSRAKVGQCLRRGDLVGVTSAGILLYCEGFSPFSSHPRLQRPEEVNTRFCGGHTSPVVALFFTRKQALKCLKKKDLKECDPRWKEETLTVLGKIGDNHPVFVISQFPDYAFTYN